MNPYVKLAISLTLITCSAFVVWSAYFPSQVSKLLGNPLRSATDTFSLKSSIQLPTAGPELFREAILAIKFPASMLENETSILEISYAVEIHAVSTEPLFKKKRYV